MIQLKEITKENYRACMNLKTTKEQEDFVAPNWYSMLEAIYENLVRRLLYTMRRKWSALCYLVFTRRMRIIQKLHGGSSGL